MQKAGEEAQSSPLIKPEKPGSLTLRHWTYKHLHSLFWGDPVSHAKLVQQYQQPAENAPKIDENFSFFSAIFLMVYGIDGYNPTTHMIIPAHRHSAGELQEAYEYKGEPLSWLIMLAAFTGLPSRTGCSEPAQDLDYKTLKETPVDDDLDQSVVLKDIPTLTWTGIGKNMLGGWDTLPDEDKYQEKKIWQWVFLIPVKLAMILPIKVISVPFKTIVSIIKTFTELLPSLATYGLHHAIAKVYANIETIENSDDDWKVPKIFFLSLFSLLLAILHMSLKLFTLIFRALFSPDKSSKLAGAYGKEVNKKLGVVVYYLNKTITSFFWAAVIPLALGAAIIYFPNAIVPVIAWFGNLPPVAAALHAMNGALVSFAIKFFEYDITPTVGALATLLHVPVSEAIAVIGATLGFFGSSIIVIVLSLIATPFSDKWAAWHEGGPFTTWLPSKWAALKNRVSALADALTIFLGLQEDAKSNDIELKNTSDPTTTTPSNKADGLVDGKSIAGASADSSSASADRAVANAEVERGPRLPNSPNRDAQNPARRVDINSTRALEVK